MRLCCRPVLLLSLVIPLCGTIAVYAEPARRDFTLDEWGGVQLKEPCA